MEEIRELKETLAKEEERFQKANSEIQILKSKIETQDRSFVELTNKVTQQQAELTDFQKANVILRSKEINADIQAQEKDQQFSELKEENEFLKAQVIFRWIFVFIHFLIKLSLVGCL